MSTILVAGISLALLVLLLSWGFACRYEGYYRRLNALAEYCGFIDSLERVVRRLEREMQE